MFILLTSPRCEECVKAKEVLRRAGIEFREVSVTTDEGLKIGVAYGLTHVPALIADKVYIGLNEIKKFIKNKSD